MFHSLRHRASTTNRPIGIDDECLSPSGGKPSKQQRWKSKPCPVRGGAGGPRNPREEDEMILPRGFWPASTNCCKCCLVGTVATILFLFLLLQSAYMMGDGYSSNGGIVGEYVDRWILARYEQETAQRQRTGIVFPDVQVKATRRMERAHYSSYLEHILRLHQGPNAASNASVEPVALLPRQHIEMVRPVLSERPRNEPNADMVTVTGATASFAVAKAGDLIADLRKEKCHSNWLCQRCLNAPFRGTYEACAALCRQCYIRILSTIPGRKDEPIQISGVRTNTDQIPRIIHQAWHFYPSSSDYPELSRLMARWRNSDGYEYNFYTGYHEQDVFVNEHFPPIVGKALNAIPTRLSRLAFFRLLVLYKMGGVFADVNLMLETNLDVIIQSPTTFVAARSPGLLDNCLWVGFIAAAPGHPVIARSIENIIRSLLLGTHTNSVALERDLMGKCANPHVVDVWKFRSSNADYVFKDCSLGLSYNQIFGTANMSPTSPIRLTVDQGGTNRILVLANDDAGATRLTDLGLNMLVATAAVGLSDASLRDRGVKTTIDQRRNRQETVV